MASSQTMGAIRKFGPFCLDLESSILFHGNQPTALGGRAIALLRLLIEQAGTPVSKDALIEAAWPGLAVEESNLSVQIAALRRVLEDLALGAHWIETLPRRGYRYIGPAVATDTSADGPDRPPVPALALPEAPSIAVLPFVDSTAEPDRRYIADGIVDDIIGGLSRIKWLFVIARGSSFAYREAAHDPGRVGRELGVRYLLRGSVRRDGSRVRLSAQMIEAATGRHVWSERFDRQLDDIFALQDDIALAVVGAIEPGLRRVEVERVKRKRPESLSAYDLVLRAQPDVDSGMPDRVSAALVQLRQALALDPNYALAHGSAAMCYHCLFLRAGLDPGDRDASIHHARAAMLHGQDDALALTYAGFSLGMDGHDHAAAFAAFEAALAISPSSALTYILGSVIFGWAGEADGAIDWSGRGLRLSPFDNWAFAAFHGSMLGHFHLGRYELAAEAAYSAIQRNPGHSISSMLLAAALVKLGRLSEARAAAARVLELQPNFRCGSQFSGVNCAPALAASLSEALRATALPD